MKPELKKIHAELIRKAALRTDFCPLKIKCDLDFSNVAYSERLDHCSNCYLNWLYNESEV